MRRYVFLINKQRIFILRNCAIVITTSSSGGTEFKICTMRSIIFKAHGIFTTPFTDITDFVECRLCLAINNVITKFKIRDF